MTRPLPSLISLRVFEVAGRLQSFSKAAEELNVTQGAVSRQIRALEDELGVKLFTRLTRRVELTDDARRYLVEVQAAFRQMEKATAWICSHQERHVLHINVLPSIGSYWLMPRLATFTQRHPNIETRINSSIEPADLHSHGTEIAIRVGPKPGASYDPRLPGIDLTMTIDWRDVLAEELAPDVLVPIYSPDILEPSARLDEPSIFQNLPLIHTTSRPDAWAGWMKTYGLSELPATPRIEYGHFFMSLHAAQQGLGIALIPDIVLANIDTKGLHIAREYKARSAGEYYMLSLKSRANDYPIYAFREWTKEQFAG
ncbi:MAG: LysR substrate-binding domain-containing protein [Pusillimonas sp.]